MYKPPLGKNFAFPLYAWSINFIYVCLVNYEDVVKGALMLIIYL